MKKILHNCVCIVMCIALVVGLNPAHAIAYEGSADSSSTTTAQEATEAGSTASTEDQSGSAAASSSGKAETEKKAEASSEVSTATKAAEAPAASATKSAKASAVKTLAATPKAAGATYAAVTSDRDITNNLLDPVPTAKFENPVGSGDYYSVDELKAKFGDDFKIYVGDSVWVKFKYSGLTNVQPGEALTFPIPDGLDGSEVTVQGIIKDGNGNEQGKYWLADGNIHL